MSSDETAVIKARNYADIVKLSEPTVAEQFLAEPLAVIIQTVTGLFAEGPKGFVIAGSHLVQAVLKGHMLEQFAREFNELRAKGAIADNFEETKYGFQTWAELISIIDEDRPDADRLEALKAMFLAVNKVNSTDGERIVAYQLWMIAKELNSGELLLLKAAYSNSREYKAGLPADFRQWCSAMALRLGHNMLSLVELHDKKLVEFGLLSTRQFKDESGIIGNRQTDVGLRFCENIESYNLQIKSSGA